MNAKANIQGFLSSAESASILGVSTHQVAALVRAGELAAVNAAGRTLMISVESVRRYKQLHQGKGRPLNAQTAFAALFAISGITTKSLSYPQNRRLKQKLQVISAEDLVWQTRKRADVQRYRCSESFLKELASRVTLSGLNALNGNFDLTNATNTLEGYVCSDTQDSLIDEFFLEEDLKGNVILHVTRETYSKDACMPIGFVAADLSESLNTREHSAGINKLKELLDKYRSV